MFFEAPDNILMMNAGSAFAGTMIGIAVAVIWTIGQAVTQRVCNITNHYERPSLNSQKVRSLMKY